MLYFIFYHIILYHVVLYGNRVCQYCILLLDPHPEPAAASSMSNTVVRSWHRGHLLGAHDRQGTLIANLPGTLVRNPVRNRFRKPYRNPYRKLFGNPRSRATFVGTRNGPLLSFLPALAIRNICTSRWWHRLASACQRCCELSFC